MGMLECCHLILDRSAGPLYCRPIGQNDQYAARVSKVHTDSVPDHVFSFFRTNHCCRTNHFRTNSFNSVVSTAAVVEKDNSGCAVSLA